uniref:Coiled-coil domain-containing protein 27 n=1 Tax=Chelydra serpentina TaxID=8475 RepID=A0A8C3SCR0_CHESE
MTKGSLYPRLHFASIFKILPVLLSLQYSEMQQKGLRQEDMEKELLSGTEIEVASEEEEENEAEAEEKASLIKLREFQQMNQELCKELEKAKTDYDMATGAITSLQRQLAFQESQLRRTESEKEMLQKELRERGNQLQAMSAKFSSLREERKHEEMMGIIERENYKLRQVTHRHCSLSNNKLTDDLQSKINQLQAKVVVAQHHMQKQLGDQSEMQSQVEALKHAEQQAKVALECISARFERFRSKIIQATYSTAGAKSPQAEISDEEALEAMQRIISERLDFHQMLKQKGVKVPSLLSTEPANLSSPNSKTNKKSPVK